MTKWTMILPLKKLATISPALSLSLDAFLRRNNIHSLGFMKLSSMDRTKVWWINELSFGLCIGQSE
jgi:hypothetical protein